MRYRTKSRSLFGFGKGSAMPDTPSNDRRIQKTRTLLLEAIGALIHEKPYQQIVVKEILNRANVGRSTFYEHFSDKDELVSSAMQHLLGRSSAVPSTGSRAEHIVCFSRPILEHVEHRRNVRGIAGMDGDARLALHERLRSEISRAITQDVQRAVRERAVAGERMPTDLLIGHVASSFVMVLDWWVESRSPLTVAEVDSLFRALALPVLSRALD